MAVRLIESLATTAPLADLFSDQSVLQAMLDFEVALASAEAKLGIIPKAAAKAITNAAKADDFDIASIAGGALRSGTPSVAVVKLLTERVRGSDARAAGFVHWGATSQDVADTALVLLLKRAQRILKADFLRLDKSLHALAERHAKTAMLGRTLLRAGPPITFGLKAAGWLAGLRRCQRRLDTSFKGILIVQLGGATGTAAALGKDGIGVGRALAELLDLDYPNAPWHAHRDRLAAVLCDCGVLTGCLGKMARDISLLGQNEVGEVQEPQVPGRGGSSTMPQKNNPVGCAVTLASACRVPGLVASYLSSMVQEHERGVGGWQAEWPVVAGTIQATGLALASMAEVAEGLEVDAARMRANIEATHGTVFSEKAMMLLSAKLGRDAAYAVVREMAVESGTGRGLSEVLAHAPGVGESLQEGALHELEEPERYLGSANEFRKRLLASTRRRIQKGKKE